MSKFKVGDKVEVIKYGHPIFSAENDLTFPLIEKCEAGYWFDMSPSIIGKRGIIVQVSNNQSKDSYAIHGIKGKHAWYNDDQLELVKNDSSKL